jgi:hypothetical protein
MAITCKDVEVLKESFATKGELASFRNEVLIGQDKIMKKLEDISLEQKMAYSQYKRHDEKLEAHERRLSVIEARI